jgi:hypothetical protein
MTTRARRLLAAAGVATLLLAARGPLHRTTHALPVSNDDAIPLLMARHVLRGEPATILWSQPYNGALDAYLLAPGLVLADPHTTFRAYEILCGLALVLLAGGLAACIGGERAGWAAAALAAVGTPYMALMAATGPTPNFLIPVLTGAALLRALASLVTARGPGLAGAAAWGLLSGLAIWDSALAVPALCGGFAGLLVAGLRPRLRTAAAFAAGLCAGASPLIVARIVGASASSSVTALRPRWLWLAGLRDVLRAGAGLVGLQVPLVVDGPERAGLPAVALVALALGLGTAVVLGATASRRTWPLLGWGCALVTAFAFSRRTGGDEVRYLYGVTLPVLALAGVGLARLLARHVAAAAAAFLAIVVPWLLGERILVRVWRDPAHAAAVWQVPPVEPVLETLRRAGVGSAYASLQFAARLALDSGEEVVASQAWNERIPGDPLRFRDEVDLDPRPAWVLHAHLSRGMPRAARFRELLQEIGGGAHEDRPGEFSVFRAFRPPFDEARPVPVSEVTVTAAEGTPLPPAVQDRDGATAWRSPQGLTRGAGVAVALVRPRRLAGLVLLVPLDPTPLATPWVVEVDGAVVARGPAPFVLQWVDGAPRAGRQALLSVVLPGTSAREVRLLFQDAGPPLEIAELFLYGPDEPEQPAAGQAAAEAALQAARRGDWDEARERYREAARLEPHRAARHAAVARSTWRARHRRLLDVESLDDGGPELVARR